MDILPDEIFNSSQIREQKAKIEFPEMKCSIHRYPIILVCTKSDCTFKIFLCSKCVSSEIKHITAHDPLMVYDEFIRYIAT